MRLRTTIPDSIVIDGTRQGERHLVVIDEQSILLQPTGFRFFAILGIQRFLGEDDGWVHASRLYRPADIVARYIYRMKRDIHNASPRLQSWRIVENDKRGNYRLIAKPQTIIIKPPGIRRFGDHDMVRMLDKLVAMEKEQPSYR